MPAKKQWDFGELFPVATTRRVWSVSELTGLIRRVLEQQVGQVWISGEVGNLRSQSSGHIYFSLKDAGAQLSCVLFRTEAISCRHLLQDGQKVVLHGDLTVYEPRGQYQLRVDKVELQGIGALQQAFELLKQKLKAEGLFEAQWKRALPRYPRRIGLVTSLSGAAIWDVMHVLQRRYPALEIILAACRVQGQGASEEIATAVRRLNLWATGMPGRFADAKQKLLRPELEAKEPLLDLILVTRGGGSLEDLWAFNEEIVARAVFESVVPVISAVGHEIDVTLCDWAADLRAATPSAGAELISEGFFSSRRFLSEAAGQMAQLVRRRQRSLRETMGTLKQRLARCHPLVLINNKWQRLDEAQAAMSFQAKSFCREARWRWQAADQVMQRISPRQIVMRRRDHGKELLRRLRQQVAIRLANLKGQTGHIIRQLRLLSPENTLARGYSITMDASSGQIIRGDNEVVPGQILLTQLASGKIHSTVVK